MTAMQFYSLASWAAWSRPWLRTIASRRDGMSLATACVVARARLPRLDARYLASLGVGRIGELDAEHILRLAGVEGLLNEFDSPAGPQ